MADFPYHVVGGAFTPNRSPLQLFDSIINAAPGEKPASPQTSRRRKLWEIPHKFHCPVIGTCFDVAELRGLMKKVMHFPTTNFVLHTTAVVPAKREPNYRNYYKNSWKNAFSRPSVASPPPRKQPP